MVKTWEGQELGGPRVRRARSKEGLLWPKGPERPSGHRLIVRDQLMHVEGTVLSAGGEQSSALL